MFCPWEMLVYNFILLSNFGYQGMQAWKNKLRNVSSSSIFCKSLYMIGITYSLIMKKFTNKIKCTQNFHWEFFDDEFNYVNRLIQILIYFLSVFFHIW